MTHQSAPPSPSTSAQPSAYRFLRLAAVCELCGLSRSQIYRMQAAGLFPKSVKLGQSASAWLDTEIMQWQADRVAASRSQMQGKPAAERPGTATAQALALAKLRARMPGGGR